MDRGLIIVSAPSGTGKSTLCGRLLRELPESVRLSISTTSRSPRGQEQNGVEYYFVSSEDFKAKIAEDEFAEWALVHENYYGTSKETLHSFWRDGAHVLLDIDVQGAMRLKSLYNDRALLVFLEPPSIAELERRLRARATDPDHVIERRMKNALDELSRKNDFDVVIVNDDLDQAYLKLKAAVVDFSQKLETGTWRR
jgi:guanylate kinase